jgi:hypothetical protein
MWYLSKPITPTARSGFGRLGDWPIVRRIHDDPGRSLSLRTRRGIVIGDHVN